MEMSHDNVQKRREYLYMEVSRNTGVYKSSDLHFSNHCSTFILNFQLASSTYQHSVSFSYGLQHYRNLGKTSLHRLCGLWQVSDRFGRFSGTKNDSNYLDIEPKLLKREDKNAEFQLRQNLSMGEADFNQFIRQRYQLVVAAENFLRVQNLSTVLQSTLSKDMEEQLKLVHEVIDIVDRPKRKICVTLLRYKVDNPESSHAQVRLFGLNNEEKKFNKLCRSTLNLTNLYIFLTS